MDKTKVKIANILRVGKIDFITGILYIVGALIFITWFFFECRKDSFSIILLPFVALVVLLTIISANIKIFTYRNSLFALKEYSKDNVETDKTSEYIKKSLKRNIESSIMDLICSLIWVIYIVYSRVKYFGGEPIDTETVVHATIGMVMLILAIVKALPGFKAFSMYFNTNKEEKE